MHAFGITTLAIQLTLQHDEWAHNKSEKGNNRGERHLGSARAACALDNQWERLSFDLQMTGNLMSAVSASCICSSRGELCMQIQLHNNQKRAIYRLLYVINIDFYLDCLRAGMPNKLVQQKNKNKNSITRFSAFKFRYLTYFFANEFKKDWFNELYYFF